MQVKNGLVYGILRVIGKLVAKDIEVNTINGWKFNVIPESEYESMTDEQKSGTIWITY